MTDTITVTGLVATEPRHIETETKLTITSFRLASNQRRYDRATNSWIDGDTNWYTITAFRQLGMHAATSLRKGDRIIVTGRVRQREWESEKGKGITFEIDADALGHDLTFGRSTFTRTVKASDASAKTSEGSDGAGTFPTSPEASSSADARLVSVPDDTTADEADTPF
ncbi:MAG TPA: single-stranded DNA-binding protein [Microcella sp.]|nr:single-stranded DNA-binding protein [Microcella sp.]